MEISKHDDSVRILGNGNLGAGEKGKGLFFCLKFRGFYAMLCIFMKMITMLHNVLHYTHLVYRPLYSNK